MFSSKNSSLIGIALIALLTITLYWQFFLLGKIPMPGDTLIGAYFPWLDYKWGFPVGVPVKNALISDVFSQFFIWKYQIVDIFTNGQIPLWNIYSLSGTPILSTYHSAVFNPFNLLLFLPGYFGWGLYIALQTFVAMLGMYLFSGTFVKNFWSRIFGALVFSLSGLMTTWTEFGTGVWAAGQLPWIFLFLEKYLNERRIRYLFLLSISFIILYLSGHAQLTLYSTVLVFIYLSVKFIRKGSLTKFIWPAVFIVLAISFCSFQFLPAYEFTKDSIRQNEAYSSSFNFGLNPWYEAIKFFAPDFFGNPTTNNYWDSQSYHEQSIFLGTLPFIMILSCILFYLKRRKIDFWSGVFLSTMVLGFENPLSKLIYSLPLPFLTYSSAARIFFITSFSAGILVALAFERLSDEKFDALTKKINLYLLSAILGIFLGFSGLVLLFNDNTDLITSTTNFKVTVKNLVIPAAISLTGLILLMLLNWKPKLKQLLLIVFVAVTFADLFRYFNKYNPFFSRNLIFPKTPVIEFLQNRPGLFRIGRLDPEIMPPNTWAFYKLQSVEGYDPLVSENYARFFNLVKAENYGNTLSRYRELDNFNPKFLDALNVKYLLSVKRDEKNNAKGDILDPKIETQGYSVVFEDGNSVVAVNPNAMERAYFVSGLQYSKTKEDLVRIISSDNFDPRKEALVMEELNIPGVTGLGQVDILNYSPNKIEFKTRTKNDEFLIFADTYNKGWLLKRNGIPERIYETNLALRGIVVPSGENSFVMEYFPDSFKYGLWISGLSGTVFLIILFYSLRKKTI